MKKLLYIFTLLLPVSSYGQMYPVVVGAGTPTGFTPPTTSLAAHYDASVAASVTVATGVSQWADLSGNGYHLLQASAGKQPVYSGSGTTSKITFNGSSQTLQASFTLTQPTTVYFIAKQVTWPGGTRYLFDGAVANNMIVYQNTASPKIAMYAGGVVGDNSGATIGTMVVITAVFNGASSSLSVNNNTKTTGNAGAAAGAGITVGSIGGAALGNFSNIEVQEIYIYSAAHSAATQTSMITYLRNKWGI